MNTPTATTCSAHRWTQRGSVRGHASKSANAVVADRPTIVVRRKSENVELVHPVAATGDRRRWKSSARRPRAVMSSLMMPAGLAAVASSDMTLRIPVTAPDLALSWCVFVESVPRITTFERGARRTRREFKRKRNNSAVSAGSRRLIVGGPFSVGTRHEGCRPWLRQEEVWRGRATPRQIRRYRCGSPATATGSRRSV